MLAVLVMLALSVPSIGAAQGSGPLMLVRDSETEAFVRSIAHPLFRAAGVNPGLVRIALIQDRGLNAFVTTGNRMFLNTGLIQQADGAGEFIGVLAHEVGHVAGGHVSRMPEEMRNAMLRNLGAMILGGAAAAAGSPDAAGALIMGGQASALQQFMAFSRAQEQAADHAAVVYLERLGWSARGIEAVLVRLLDQELLAAHRQDAYFRTHPLSRDRLLFIREHIARSPHSGTPFPPAIEQGFLMVRAKLQGFVDPPIQTHRRYPESDTSAPARYARAIMHFRSGRPGLAVALLEEMAREQPSVPWLHELQGQVLFESGQVREAVAPYRRAALLAPDAPLIRTALGRALLESGEAAAARREFEAALALEGDSAFTWRQLGLAHGRLGETGLADLASAEAALLDGDFAAARMLSARAEAALPRGPARLRASDLRNATRRENMTPEERRLEDARRRGEWR